MLGLGLVIVALGAMTLVWAMLQKRRAPVLTAPLVATKAAAQPGTRRLLATQGEVQCDAPLMSPVTKTPCLFYSLRAVAIWTENDSEQSRELHREKNAASFSIDDGTGPVKIDAKEGGDFEPMTLTEKSQGAEAFGSGDGLPFLGTMTGAELTFGDFRIGAAQCQPLRTGTLYRVEETVLPLQKQLYVCGTAGDGTIVADERGLVLSHRTHAQLIASTANGAKLALTVGGVALALGAVLTVAAAR